MSYYLVILFLSQRQQKNKRWCTGKGSERIVWVPGQQSRLQVSSQFKKRSFPALFCAEMALKTWNNVNRLKWRKGASEMMSAWQQTESKSITEGRQVHGGTPTHSCSYPFREVKKKSWKNLPIPYHLPGHCPSHRMLTEQGCGRPWKSLPAISFQLWRISLPGRIDSKKSELLFLWRIHILCVSLQFSPILHLPVAGS